MNRFRTRLLAAVPFLIALLPFLLALAAGIIYQLLAPRPLLIVRLSADPGTLLILLGGLVSLILIGIALTRRYDRQVAQRELDAQARAQQEVHRRFLRRLDHEMKNPLTALRAALANLSTAAPEDRPRIQAEVQHQVERLTRLTGDLRKLAELEERPLEQIPVDVTELLDEVVDSARSHPAYAGRDVHLAISRVPWPLPPVTGDRDLLWLAFYNLVDNALKYSREPDSVEVRAVEDGRALTVEVANTGPGIDPDDLPRLFEELYRGSNARGFEGSGLGLALTQRVIARHGGEISVRSRHAGSGGTVFSVRLPIGK